MIKIRQSARLVVLDNAHRVLLFQSEDAIGLDPTQPHLTLYWATPGGGLELGETFEQAAQRELWEETGIREVHIGPWIWTRERELILHGEKRRSYERYFLCHVLTTDVNLTNLTEEERHVYRDHRWWSLEEMRCSLDTFIPATFAHLLGPILTGNIPEYPLVIE